MLRVSAPAKVNLFLGVGALRPDGFHDVTTVMHALELCDVVELVPAAALTLTCEPDLGIPTEENLAYCAAVAIAREFEREPAVALRVSKRIPHGAGLGGGSSDAAAVIAGMASLWGADPADPRCLRAAAQLGADVPFFLASSGTALMSGRGDVLDRVLGGLDGAPVALVRPPAPVPTARAYAAFDADPQAPGTPEAVLAALAAHDVGALGAALANNLERAASVVVPAVGEALAMAAAMPGVAGAAVAGSGSAVFALCDTVDAARSVAAAAVERGWWGEVTALRGAGVTVAHIREDA